MRLRIRHVARDGTRLKREDLVDAKNPLVGAKDFAHARYVAVGERIDVRIEQHHDMLNYEVIRSRIDEDGCRVRYIGKNS